MALVSARQGFDETLRAPPSTVSNAFNRPERLSSALRERVVRAAAEFGC